MISKIFFPEPLRQKLTSSPTVVRVVPFVIFVLLTSLQGSFGETGRYWIYFLKSLVGAWLLWMIWPAIAEMKWTISLEAVLVGIGVFVIWVGIDPFYPRLNELLYKIGLSSEPKPTTPWNPFTAFGENTALAWFFVVARIVGSSIVVPPLEETFYRSFLYRWIIKQEFHTVPLTLLNQKALWGTALVFGLAHHEWLAGILCGLAYQWLVLKRGHLGDAMTAHAITNFLLGIWVVWKGAWQFW